jgi:polysaccharide chain length determinant protein (PEP-CTERM system associated)
MEQTEIQTYIDIASRRKWWIILSILLTLLAGLAYVMFAPSIYEAKAVLLVQSQKVPENVVDPMISSIDDRVTMITQQVTSRSNLERLIRKYSLYALSSENEIELEKKVELFKDAIKIEPTYQTQTSAYREIKVISAFSISYRYNDPGIAADVTNELVSNIVSENLKMREDHVLGTSAFLLDELESVQDKLAIKEEELKQYREKYMGGLPEQLDANLKLLERLDLQSDQLNRDLRAAENKKFLIKEQIATSTVIFSNGEPISTDISELRKQLASLELKYSENHPDIIRLRKMISKVDEEIAKLGTDLEKGNLLPGVDDKLRFEFQNTMLEINDIKADIAKVQAEKNNYENIIAQSPRREQELLALKRDYDNLTRQYDTLYNRKVEAEIAVSMERKQKGEQFEIIEKAIPPTNPVAPRISAVMILALAFGLGLGSGLAVLLEMMDTSYKTPDEVKKDLYLPILAELPIQYTEKEAMLAKKKQVFVYVTVGLGFVLSAAGIVIASQGYVKILEWVQNYFSGA